MIIPIVIAIISEIFYAFTNHIDKYLISKTVKNNDYRALALVSSIVAGGVMTLIYFFVCNFSLEFDYHSVFILFISSIFYTLSVIFWFKALSHNDTTLVAIMLQLIPVFMLFISPLFLPNQSITIVQLIGGIIITIASIFVIYEPSKKRIKKEKLFTLTMMALSSVSYALWFVLQRYINLTHDFNKTVFWSYATLFLVGIIILFFIRSYRKSFQVMLKSNGPKVIGLNLVNELLASFGGVLAAFAGTMAPVTLISFTSQGVQPFIVMLLGFLITKFFPKIEKENITKKEVSKRIFAIILCIIGLACLEFG